MFPESILNVIKTMAHRVLASLILFACSMLIAWAESSFFGIYLEGQKVGYSVMRQERSSPDGDRDIAYSESFLRTALMGTPVEMRITSRTRLDAKGRPLTMEYVTESGGRRQTVNAQFEASVIRVKIDNNGSTSERTLTIPEGARVVDDATSALVLEGPSASTSFRVHVLDPTTVTLLENEVTVRGKRSVQIGGRSVEATLVEVRDVRAVTRIYYNSKSEVLKIEAPLGMVMLPEPEEVAKRLDGGQVDLGDLAAIQVVPGIDRPLDVVEWELFIPGAAGLRLPSDTYQTVAVERGGLRVRVHPERTESVRGQSIREAQTNARRWTLPSLHIPSDTPRFRELARRIIGNETNVVRAAILINRWVDREVADNAGIGILRDANEVLDSREGVCRDAAILAATLMRAAGIPTRLVSGLILDQGRMYYHAWVEIWSGRSWLMLDPTRSAQLTHATRLKMAHGQVEDAFTFPVLEASRFEVRKVVYRNEQ